MANFILYNPNAGNGKAHKELDSLLAFFDEAPTCLDMTRIESYETFFATLGTDDAVILCGGDGTLNRFVNDTEDLTIPCDLLYYALGSGNDFLRDVNRTTEDGPFSVKEYLRDLPTVEVKGKTYRFLNNVGFGIDGYCCEVGDIERSKSDKPVNYTAIAIKGLLFHYKPCSATITVDGKEYRHKKVWIAPTMKGRYYGGGMMSAPAQDRKDPDGTLSVVVLHTSGRLRTLMAFPSIFKGELVKHKKINTIYTGKTIHVKFDAPATVQIDGETILDVTEYTAYARIPVKA